MSKKIYAIILTKSSDGGYVVHVPDLDIGTQGDSIAEAIEMARDAIGIWGICREDINQSIPEPKDLQPHHEEDEIVTLVDIDFEEYRRQNDSRVVRKNCTIPNWLNEAALKQNVNFSKVLQEALQAKLQL